MPKVGSSNISPNSFNKKKAIKQCRELKNRDIDKYNELNEEPLINNKKINTYTNQSIKPDITATEINNTLKTEVEKIKKEAQEDGLKIENTGLARNIEALIKVLEENKDKRVKFE